VPYQGAWRPFIFEHDGQRVTDRVLVVWSDGKQRLDQQKRRTYLKRLLNGLDVVQKKLNSGRDKNGIPCAILSYANMHKSNLPAGGPLDLRLNRHLVTGDEGTQRMVGLVRSFVETGGNMMTLTVVDTEELRAAQITPEQYRSLRVRMGGWCAYFTMLSREQQDHHIRRQEGKP